MNSLDSIRNHDYIRKYFIGKLDLDEEEFERRLQIYLEIFPFIALDFRLKQDCHAVHKTAQFNNDELKLTQTNESISTYRNQATVYQDILGKLRANMEVVTVEVT